MKEIIEYLKGKYPNAEEAELKAIYEYVFMTFCLLSNQPDILETELRTIDLIWIRSACIEILERAEYTMGIISYSEAGYQVRFDSGDFSQGLKKLIMPRVRGYR